MHNHWQDLGTILYIVSKFGNSMLNSKKLTNAQIKFLRGMAHGINPVVTIGNKGLSESLMEELESSLEYHELLKIRISAGDSSERQEIINSIISQTHSQLVQSIGKVCVIFRANPQTEIQLPK